MNKLLIGDLNLMVPIIDPINNLRSYLYAFSTDIESFFHNVLVDEEDQGVFKFFWYEDERMESLKLYIFLAHIFGASSSPTVTQFVLKRHGEAIRAMFGEQVYEIITRYFYVDDGSGGNNSIEGCKKLCKDLKAAMEMGGFSLGKWKFSHKELRSAVGEEEEEEEAEEEKILGIVWNLKEDTLAVSIEEERFLEPATTPRKVVQQQASLYDPLGIVAPFVLIGRRWTQQAMTGEWGWDRPLKEEIKKGFGEWTSSIPLLKSLSIPRSLNVPDSVGAPAQLHFFSDASKGGFGTVGYWRVVLPDGSVRLCFVGGKSHVVPLDATRTSHHNSIPRLELVSALKSVELMRAIQKSLPMEVEDVVFWTDAICVWRQIRDETGTPKAFVANRVSKIRKKSKPS